MNNLIYTLTYLTVAVAAEIVSEDKTNDKISLLRSRNLLDHVEQTLAEPSTSTTTHTKQRELESYQYPGTNCWINTNASPPSAEWHPVYSQGWLGGSCQFTIDCNSPGYDTELDCCKGSYPDQSSGYCLSQLPNPPTLSPTGTGGLDVYYPDYNAQWSEAYCINTRQGIILNKDGTPRDRPSYSSMLECCKSAYASQMSGKCISMLPEEIRPTTSPTNADRTVDFWYPMYEMSWSKSGCSNKLPLPFNNVNDRPNYSTGEECCAKAYGGQTSMACVCEHLDTPQLGCPGIIEYEKTTVTTVVTSTISFGAITVPTDPDEKADLVADLEAAILASLPPLGDDVQVRIIAIGGVSVRRMLREDPNARLLSSSDVEVEIVVKTEVEEDQGSEESTTDPDVAAAAVADQVVNQVTAATSDTANLEDALQNSDNAALTSVTVQGTIVDQNPVTTSSTETVVGTAGPTSSPTSSPSQSPTNSPLPPTTSPTHSPSLSPSKVPTNGPSKSPSSSPTSVPSYSQQPSSQPSSQPSMSLEPSLAPSSCTNFITVNEDTQEAGTLPNDFDSDYNPPMTCGSGSNESCECTGLVPGASVIPDGCTEFPIGGSGIVDEGFTMLTLPNGNQVGIRAAERNAGVTNVNPTAAGNGIGSYEVQTGSRTSNPDDNAWWNIDWHVDLRPGGETIADYQADGVGLRMTAECISGSCGSFGTYDFDLAPSTYATPSLPSDWDAAFGSTPTLLGATMYGNDWNLLQASQNPGFNIWPWSPFYTGDPFSVANPGSNEFDKDAEATYEFCLLLGDDCPVCIEVVASNP